MVRAVSIALCLGSAALFGCAGEELTPRTELMLVADTDIPQLDHIEFDVSRDGRVVTSDKIAVDISDAPFTLAVLREQGPLGPLTARAVGYHGEVALVERSALVSFSRGKTLTVVLHLVQSCRNQQCSEEETCTERGCEPLDAAVVTPWRGTPPRLGDALDGGAPGLDAGSDAGSEQEESGARADGEGAHDAAWMRCGALDVDINSNVDHCGECDRVCRTTTSSGSGSGNLVPACVDGECAVTCRSLWGDCDGDDDNGCENWLAYDTENCGACGMTCAAEESCWLGTCRPR